MNHTLRVPRSRVDSACLDQLIDEISSAGKARSGETSISRMTRKPGIPKHREMVALDATGPIRTFSRLPDTVVQHD